jgi:uncharacterized protein (DUF58 family)
VSPGAPDRATATATAEDPTPPARARGTRRWWSGVVPVPTLRAALLLVVGAAVLLVAPPVVAWWWALVAVVVAVVVDGVLAPAPWRIGVERELPGVLPLDGEGTARWTLRNPTARPVQVAVADELAPSLGATDRRVAARVPASGRASAEVALHPRRRGTFRPTVVTVRVTGPMGLAVRQADRDLPGHLEVHPSFRSRAAAELRLRRARLLDDGARAVRGRGGGTEFEALREYVEGDEFRHVDWAATARAGRPVVRTYRAERHQQVVVLLDTGRTMAGLVDGVPRLDHAMDATLALATVATHLGDRVGLLAFGGEVGAVLPARRDAAQLRRLSAAMHALEPELAESGYREAFRTLLSRYRRRALVVILTELAAEAVQDTLLPALPLVARDHAVVVAAVRDPAELDLVDSAPHRVDAAYAAAAAAGVQRDRARTSAQLAGLGVQVVDAPPGDLAARLVDRYLDIKRVGGW